MPQEGLLTRFLHFLRVVVIVDLGIAAFVVAAGLLLGWRTLREFGDGLIYAGVGAWLVGLASVISSLGLSRSFDYQYAQSVGVHSIDENVREAMKESKESYSFLWLMGTVGIILLFVGVLLAQSL